MFDWDVLPKYKHLKAPPQLTYNNTPSAAVMQQYAPPLGQQVNKLREYMPIKGPEVEREKKTTTQKRYDHQQFQSPQCKQAIYG